MNWKEKKTVLLLGQSHKFFFFFSSSFRVWFKQDSSQVADYHNNKKERFTLYIFSPSKKVTMFWFEKEDYSARREMGYLKLFASTLITSWKKKRGDPNISDPIASCWDDDVRLMPHTQNKFVFMWWTPCRTSGADSIHWCPDDSSIPEGNIFWFSFFLLLNCMKRIDPQFAISWQARYYMPPGPFGSFYTRRNQTENERKELRLLSSSSFLIVARKNKSRTRPAYQLQVDH